jgi:hypothetical protein
VRYTSDPSGRRRQANPGPAGLDHALGSEAALCGEAAWLKMHLANIPYCLSIAGRSLAVAIRRKG